MVKHFSWCRLIRIRITVGVNTVTIEDVYAYRSDDLFIGVVCLKESVKFMAHGKRSKLNTCDIDDSMKAKNLEVGYGD